MPHATQTLTQTNTLEIHPLTKLATQQKCKHRSSWWLCVHVYTSFQLINVCVQCLTGPCQCNGNSQPTQSWTSNGI